MRAHTSSPTGPKGCQRSFVRPQSNQCPRRAVRTRDTGKTKVNLCAKCDASFGSVVGPLVGHWTTDGVAPQ